MDEDELSGDTGGKGSFNEEVAMPGVGVGQLLSVLKENDRSEE